MGWLSSPYSSRSQNFCQAVTNAADFDASDRCTPGGCAGDESGATCGAHEVRGAAACRTPARVVAGADRVSQARRTLHWSPVAQSVERSAVNRLVAGSSPARGARTRGAARWDGPSSFQRVAYASEAAQRDGPCGSRGCGYVGWNERGGERIRTAAWRFCRPLP